MNDQPGNQSSRLNLLEELITHQDRMIAELNEVITSHWRKIEVLEKEVARLREELQNIGPARDAPEAPPPHY
jgi:SlyX protein